MRTSKAEIYLHIVWATWNREPLIIPSIERAIYRCIEQECARLECDLLAISGMPDHVHIAVKIPTKLSVAKLMQQIKGVSSHFVRENHLTTDIFRWQEGYGVFSFARNQRTHVISYIEGQKEHHVDGSVHRAWEETGCDIQKTSPICSPSEGRSAEGPTDGYFQYPAKGGAQ